MAIVACQGIFLGGRNFGFLRTVATPSDVRLASGRPGLYPAAIMLKSKKSAGRVAIFVFLAAALGCGPRAALTLHQPNAPAVQQKLELASDWACVAAAEGKRAVLVDFPLPGSAAGPRDFRVYLELPARDGKFAAGAGQPVRGFFIQEVGRRSGKTLIADGFAQIDAPLLRPNERVLELDLSTDDGTRLVGKARLRSDDLELQRFRARFSADVAALEASENPARIVTEETVAEPAEAAAPVEAAAGG
jgi:hypothetical protein